MHDRLCWLIQNLPDVPASEDWLSEAERKRLSGMRFPKRRNDWKLGRWTAKQAVCAYHAGTISSPSDVEIRTAEDGAPEAFVRGCPGEFSISISHSHGKGFCIIGSRDLRVGCDLELMEIRECGFFEDYFTPEELSFCKTTPETLRPLVGYLIWSAKETALKILREGLRRDTRSVRIYVDPWIREESWNSWSGQCMDSSGVFHGWWRVREDFIYTMGSNRPTFAPEQLGPFEVRLLRGPMT